MATSTNKTMENSHSSLSHPQPNVDNYGKRKKMKSKWNKPKHMKFWRKVGMLYGQKTQNIQFGQCIYCTGWGWDWQPEILEVEIIILDWW